MSLAREGQQSLTSGFVPRSNGRAVVKEVEFSDRTQSVALVARHEKLPDEWADGFDGVRYGEG